MAFSLKSNSAALELSSEEVLARFRDVLTAKVLERLRVANAELSKHGAPAVQGDRDFGVDLELVPL